MRRGLLLGALVLLPGGSVVAGGWWLYRRWRVKTLADKLDSVLPPRLAQWAPQLADAADASCPSAVRLDGWALAFAGIVDRESGGGVELTPRGPAGTGDEGHGHGLGQVDDRPARAGRSDYEQQLGRKRLAHIASGDWKVPSKHLRFCAVEIFRGAFDQFSDLVDVDVRLAAAVAAYNAGVDHVRAALDKGQDPSSVTTGDDYASDVLARSDGWLQAATATAV